MHTLPGELALLLGEGCRVAWGPEVCPALFVGRSVSTDGKWRETQSVTWDLECVAT